MLLFAGPGSAVAVTNRHGPRGAGGSGRGRALRPGRSTATADAGVRLDQTGTFRTRWANQDASSVAPLERQGERRRTGGGLPRDGRQGGTGMATQMVTSV